MFTTVSAREIQRQYTKILKQANRENRPIVVMSNNKPVGAVIGLEMLEKFELDAVLKKAIDDHKNGKTTIVDTPEKLKSMFEDMRQEAN